MALLSLIGRLALNTDNFEAGLKKADGAVNKFSASLVTKLGAAAAAAFSVATVERMIDRVKEHAYRIKDLSEQYSITTDEVQKLDKASGKIGLSFESVATAISRIQKARALAAAGGAAGDSAFDIFARAGIDRSTVLNNSISAIEIMRKMGSSASNPAADFELLGKNAIVVRNVMAELAKLGPVKLIDGKDIEQLDKAEKSLKRMRKEVDVLIGMPLAKRQAAAELNAGEFVTAVSKLPWWAIPLSAVVAPRMGTEMIKSIATGKPMVPLSEEDEKRPAPTPTSTPPRSISIDPGKEIRNIIGPYLGQAAGNSLTSVGGYFFGGNVNSEIAKNTKETASAVQEIKKDVSAFRSAMGAEAP